MSFGAIVGQLINGSVQPLKKRRADIEPQSLTHRVLLASQDGEKRSTRSLMTEFDTTMSSARNAIDRLLRLGYFEEAGNEPAGTHASRRLYMFKTKYHKSSFHF